MKQLLLIACLTWLPLTYAQEPGPVAGSSTTTSITEFFDDLGARLGSGLGLGGSGNDFLEPDEAFAPTFEVSSGDVLVAQWQIAGGYYLYRDKFAFELVDGQGISLGAPRFPPGKAHFDEFFGEAEIYYDEVSVALPLSRTNADPTEITLQASYQGCADAGFCYPPLTKTVSLELPILLSTAGASGGIAMLSEQDRIAHSLLTGNRALALLAFFGFGLLLAFTPCVFPMIPILSSIIVGQGGTQDTRRAFILSLSYVLAMALTYTVLGVVAGLFGANLQAASQSPWILGSFSAIFILLALSMFGLYELQLPSALQTRFAAMSGKQRGGSLAGVGVMGFLSALIVGPCVAAPLAAALIVIGQTGDPVLGGSALFALSLGMGVPLLVIGTSLGKWLPKAGPWMGAIKAVFGVLLLAVAIWMLERILPPAITLFLWAALIIITSVYLGALQKIGLDAPGWRTLGKGLGVVMLIYGAVLMVGAATGGRYLLQPLQGLTTQGTNSSASQHALAFKPVKGLQQLRQEIALASSEDRPVMLDFYADWCVACKEMEKYTFSDPAVQSALSDMVLLQADVTPYDAQDRDLLKELNLIGPPAILFFGPDGIERGNYRLVGFSKAEDFLAHVQDFKLPALAAAD